MAHGIDSSKEDEDEEDDIRWRLWCSRWSVHSSGMDKDDEEAAAYKATLGRVRHRPQESMVS